jgi:hypothetical protein
MLLCHICCDINERVVERAFQCYSYVFRCGRKICSPRNDPLFVLFPPVAVYPCFLQFLVNIYYAAADVSLTLSLSLSLSLINVTVIIIMFHQDRVLFPCS